MEGLVETFTKWQDVPLDLMYDSITKIYTSDINVCT